MSGASPGSGPVRIVPALSAVDLPFLFTEDHQRLAFELVAMREAIEQAGAGLAGDDRARAVARALGARGLYGWLLPDHAGPVDVRALCLVREFLGYVSPLADTLFAVQGLGSYPVRLRGEGERTAALLRACRAGEAIGAFALTEPEAGSDVGALRAVARPREGGGPRDYVLEGDKTLISNAGIATHYVVFATVDPDAGRGGISAFLVAGGAPGLEIEPIALSVDHPIGRLRLRGCEGELLGEVGTGFRLAMQTLDTFRVTVGAAAVGMARRAFDAALEHVGQRVQFGRPLAEQQIVQTYLADMATELDAARLLVYRAAYEKDRGRDRASAEVAMAKLYATEAAQRIIDRAVQLHGGRGVEAGSVVEGLYRAIRPLRIYEGTSEIQRLIIGRQLTRARGRTKGRFGTDVK